MVRNNNTTWQSLYELYDIYGENENIWNKYLTSSHKDTFSIKGLLNTIKSIDIASLEENINSIQKAVSLVEELTKETKKEEVKAEKSKGYNETKVILKIKTRSKISKISKTKFTMV